MNAIRKTILVLLVSMVGLTAWYARQRFINRGPTARPEVIGEVESRELPLEIRRRDPQTYEDLLANPSLSLLRLPCRPGACRLPIRVIGTRGCQTGDVDLIEHLLKGTPEKNVLLTIEPNALDGDSPAPPAQPPPSAAIPIEALRNGFAHTFVLDIAHWGRFGLFLCTDFDRTGACAHKPRSSLASPMAVGARRTPGKPDDRDHVLFYQPLLFADDDEQIVLRRDPDAYEQTTITLYNWLGRKLGKDETLARERRWVLFTLRLIDSLALTQQGQELVVALPYHDPKCPAQPPPGGKRFVPGKRK